MMQWIKVLTFAFGAIFAGAFISEIPTFPGWFEMVDANQTPWLVATGSPAVLGSVLMMGGILDLDYGAGSDSHTRRCPKMSSAACV